MVFWRQRVTKVGQSAPELGHRPGYRRRSKGIGRCMAEGIVVTVFRWGHAAVLRLDDGRRLEGEQLAGDGRVNTSARRLHPSRPVTASPRRAPWRSTSLRSGRRNDLGRCSGRLPGLSHAVVERAMDGPYDWGRSRTPRNPPLRESPRCSRAMSSSVRPDSHDLTVRRFVVAGASVDVQHRDAVTEGGNDVRCDPGVCVSRPGGAASSVPLAGSAEPEDRPARRFRRERQAAVRVHRHRPRDRSEHGEVTGGIAVGSRASELERPEDRP